MILFLGRPFMILHKKLYTTEIVDYNKHPDVLTTKSLIFHKIVTRLILIGEKVDDEVDWTSLIEREKF